MSQLHSINISRAKWFGLVWSLISIGGFLFAVFYTILNNLFVGQDPIKQGFLFMGFALGCIIIGFGFGLVYARLFKIEGIDG
jgi:hypothetical protein